MSGTPPRRRRRRRRDPRAASDLVGRFRTASAAPQAATGLGPLVAVWDQVVGEVGARHTEPLRRSRAGVVSVVCSSAAWAQELSLRRDELMERARSLCPQLGIAGMRFSVGDHVVVRPPPAPSASSRPGPRPAPRDRAKGERAAEGIGDERIRALIARLAASASARGGRGRPAPRPPPPRRPRAGGRETPGPPASGGP